jgi:2-polyprenyl-3-methyl-5-hydroxy-6-metoxy-1,4-benzoquinol methylase
MSSTEKRDFDAEAARWDENPGRVKVAHDLADAIIRELAPGPEMDVLDYGCGTGLVTLRLQPLVHSVLGSDSSLGMLQVLQEKAAAAGAGNVRTRFIDLTQGGKILDRFDLVVNTMALHHVEDPAPLLREFRRLLWPGGRVVLADLDTEDGSFHSDKTGVFHHGFDRGRMEELLRRTGFEEVRTVTGASIAKPSKEQGQGVKTFTVFLLIGKRPAEP